MDKLLDLIHAKALTFGEVTLSSGIKSTFYVDAKMVTLDPDGAFLTAKVIFDLIKSDNIDSIGGMTIGADPIAGSVALISFLERRPIRAFIVRKEPKNHGKEKWVEGPIRDGDNVAIIEDVTTTGSSLLNAIMIVKQEYPKCEIVKVITLIDRSDTGRLFLKEKGYDLISVFDKSDLVFGSEK
jgi:orotate phosphoribosyltransferase